MNRASTASTTASTSTSRKPVAQRLRDGAARSRSARGVQQLLRQHPGPVHRRQQRAAGQARRTAVDDWARFAFNTHFGLLGIHDVASEWASRSTTRISARPSAAGASPPGRTWSLPFLGSSTRARRRRHWRSTSTARPARRRCGRSRCATSLYGLCLVNTRAELLDASRILEEAALDRYTFQRDAYLQRRRSLVYDGSPPREARRGVRPRPMKLNAVRKHRSVSLAALLRSSPPALRAGAPPDVLVKNVTQEVVDDHRQGQGHPGRQPRQADRGDRGQGAAALQFRRA